MKLTWPTTSAAVKQKMASRMFIVTPASRTMARLLAGFAAKVRVVVAVLVGRLAVLAGHAHVAADGQRVQRIGRLAALHAQEPGRKADGELVHADARPLCGDEMPKLVDKYQHDRIRESPPAGTNSCILSPAICPMDMDHAISSDRHGSMYAAGHAVGCRPTANPAELYALAMCRDTARSGLAAA